MDNIPNENYTDSGSLVVRVFTANGALPVEDALVTVKGSSKDNSDVIAVFPTTRSGRTPKITLPTPPAFESKSPGFDKPYATYNIDVDKDGYFTQKFINVPIFADTTSIQPVNLIPLTEYTGKAQAPKQITITEYQNPDL